MCLGALTISFPVFIDRLVKRILEVGASDQCLDGQEDFTDFKGRSPSVLLFFFFHLILGLEDAEADLSIRVDIWVINFAPEEALGWLDWVIVGAEDLKRELTTFKRCVFGSFNHAFEVPVIVLAHFNSDAWDGLSLHHGSFPHRSVLCLDHILNFY